jgi:hypothetical protein
MPSDTLGTTLVRKRFITPDQLEEALDAQILNGGRLGTNLVEMGFLSEEQLAEGLQALHKLPTAHGTIEPRPDAIAVVRPELCDKYNLMPLRIEGNRLYLAVMSPYVPEQAAELGRRLGYEVQQVVLPEFRMNQLLRKYARSFRPVRPVDLAYAASPVNVATPDAAPTPELMSEEEFQSLYASALSGGRSNSLDEAQAEVEAAEAARSSRPPSGPETPAVVSQPQVPLQVVSQSTGTVTTFFKPIVLPGEQPSNAQAQANRPLDSDADAGKPIGFAEAQAALQQTEDRQSIARVVMRFAGGKFARALLFTLQGDVAVGWEGAGEGLAGARARRVVLALKGQSSFKLVRDSRAHFLGPLRRDASTAGFFKLIGGAPQTSILMPVLAKGRVVNILYCDSGPDRPSTPDIGELLILAQKVGRSYETILARRKQSKG